MVLSGLYRGVVLNTADPQAQGRLQIRVATVGGETALWAERCMPVGGTVARTAAVPVASTVWVAFEAGDMARPVVLGVKP